MAPHEDFTWTEIQSQPDAWQQALASIADIEPQLGELARSQDYEQVIVTGCGSTYYLALAAAASLREIAKSEALALPASELWLNPRTSFPSSRRTLLIAVSRSGETSETLHAVEASRAAQRGPILTISCYAERALASMGDLNLVLPSGQEHSIAQTRAFSTLYLATLAFASLRAGRQDLYSALQQLPEACSLVLSTSYDYAYAFGCDSRIERFFFLGAGARYGLAAELSLKMKEMSLSESEPFHIMEFRHGPQSMARRGTLIVGLLSDTQRSYEEAVMNEMEALGATVMRQGVRPANVVLATVPEAIRGPLYLPFGQMLAYERAIWRGLTPDKPSQLEAVVRLT